MRDDERDGDNDERDGDNERDGDERDGGEVMRGMRGMEDDNVDGCERDEDAVDDREGWR